MREYDEYDKWRISESRAWLKHVREVWRDKQRISSSLDDTLEVIRRLAEPRGIDYARPAVRTSANVDVVADVVAAMDELAQEWRDASMRVAEEEREARRVIAKVDNAAYRQLLTLRYLNGKGWDDVAREMNYSVDYCFELHDQAALALHDHLPYGWRTRIPSAQ